MTGGSLNVYEGAGLYCSSSSPVVTNCVFEHNYAFRFGGGVYCYDSSPEFSHCRFDSNSAGGYSPEGGGGAACQSGSDATFTDCVFSGNWAWLRGDALYALESSPTVTNCTFLRNDHCNTVSCDYASPTFTNCTFANNAWNRVLMCYDHSFPVLTNCIIALNMGASVGSNSTSQPSLYCCDVFGNLAGDWTPSIADQYLVNGNFSDDPLFCDVYNDDLTLCANSPCLPDANDCGVLIGAHGEGCPDCDSPVEMTSWGAIKAMFR
jgi:hypothetical protein